MEVIANGHDIDIQNHANYNAGNDPIPNGQLHAGNENGSARIENPLNPTPEKTDFTLSQWQAALFPWILKTIHIIFRILITFSLVLKRLQKKTVTSWYYRKLCDRKNELLSILFDESCSLKDDVRKYASKTNEKHGFDNLRILADSTFKKKPLHIAFAISETNTFSFKDIGNLIAWSIAIGIKNISLYDLNGKLKEQKEMLDFELRQKLPLHVIESNTVVWNSHTYCTFNESNNRTQTNKMYDQDSELHQVSY